jgi:tryptophanyl-tRNA synthetase
MLVLSRVCNSVLKTSHKILYPKTICRARYFTCYYNHYINLFVHLFNPSSTNNDQLITKKRVLSGVQPTGNLHLGNYLGAIDQWVSNQDLYDNYFCVVDLHAITVPHDPEQLRINTFKSAATYLAAGIDPVKSKIFIQSHVKAHSELTWLLNCVTPINWLERMIQFKEKASSQGDSVGVGLFGYPVLMAADILLYQTDLVPVGEDQRQHLELARDICRRFNDLFCKSTSSEKDSSSPPRGVLKEPQALFATRGARVMSLTDGRAKMSKSAANDASRINLLDPPEEIAKKIKRCKTDPVVGLEWDNPDRPESANLLTIYQAVTGKTREEIDAEVCPFETSLRRMKLTSLYLFCVISFRALAGASLNRYSQMHLSLG